jgi:hypothetical protein
MTYPLCKNVNRGHRVEVVGGEQTQNLKINRSFSVAVLSVYSEKQKVHFENIIRVRTLSE